MNFFRVILKPQKSHGLQEIPAYHYLPVLCSSAPYGLIDHPKAIVGMEGYHVIIITSILVNTMVRRPQGITGKYAGEARRGGK
jgi:ABC-type branched-subunit amino acid transport system permease subunit